MSFGLTEDQLLDLPEAVSRLRVSPRTVERLAERGYLTRIKILGRTLYRASEVGAIIEHGTGRKLSDVERLAGGSREVAQ